VVWQKRTGAAPRKKLGLPRKPIVPLDKVEWSQADIALVSEEGAFFGEQVNEGNVLPYFR
jgi:hypothetical protein